MTNKTQFAAGNNINQTQGDGSSFAQGKKAKATTTNQYSIKHIRLVSGLWGFLGGIASSIIANLIYEYFVK